MLGSPSLGKLPNIGALGPKHYNLNGLWHLKPSYCVPWPLIGTGDGQRCSAPAWSLGVKGLTVQGLNPEP